MCKAGYFPESKTETLTSSRTPWPSAGGDYSFISGFGCCTCLSFLSPPAEAPHTPSLPALPALLAVSVPVGGTRPCRGEQEAAVSTPVASPEPPPARGDKPTDKCMGKEGQGLAELQGKWAVALTGPTGQGSRPGSLPSSCLLGRIQAADSRCFQH